MNKNPIIKYKEFRNKKYFRYLKLKKILEKQGKKCWLDAIYKDFQFEVNSNGCGN